MQLAASEPSIPLRRIKGIDRLIAKKRLEELELPYIRVGSRWRNVPPQTVAAILANYTPPMAVTEIAYLFDESTAQVEDWVSNGALVCTVHARKPSACLAPACMRRYIHGHGTISDRWQWYRRRMIEREEFYDYPQLLLRLGKPTINEGLKTGRLPGVQLPGQAGWRFLRSDVRIFAASQQ